MLIDVVEVKVLSGYKIFLRFEDGVSGEVDISKIIPFEGVFAKLKDPDYFSKVSVNSELGTICWDNGADISPAFLYECVTTN